MKINPFFKTSRVLKYLSITILLLATNICFASDVMIITNKSVAEKNMSSKEIKDIFLGKKKKWSDNTKINFVVSDDENLHDAFLKTYIRKTIKQYDAYWKNMLFTGKGTPPQKFETTKKLIEYIANTEGAIGYIDSGSTASNVNTISVE